MTSNELMLFKVENAIFPIKNLRNISDWFIRCENILNVAYYYKSLEEQLIECLNA